MSIQFKHIKDTKCPHCGYDIANISISGFHCNGEQFENVEFRCGYSYRYVPNFSRFEEIRKCPRTKEAQNKSKKTDKLFAQMKKTINICDLPNDERSRLWRMLFDEVSIPKNEKTVVIER